MSEIEMLFENYKARYNEETPMSREQQDEYEKLLCVMEENEKSVDIELYKKQCKLFESMASYARASEKAGFVLGFKMAMKIILACK